jgi:prepilin-type N-terminal cleavage/methylation domain-containing protein
MGRAGTQAGGRFGVTLVELLVVLAILGVLVGVTGLAMMSLRAPRESAWVGALRRARAEAVRSGRAVEIALDSLPSQTAQPATRLSARFLPDGRAIGPALDPLTGAPNNAAR